MMATTNCAGNGRRAHLETTTIAEVPRSLSLRGTSGERPGERGTFHRIGAANWIPLSRTLSPLLRRGEREAASDTVVVSRCDRGRHSWRLSCDKGDWKPRERSGRWHLSILGLFAAVGLCFCEDHAAFAKRAEQNYQEARKKFQNNTNDAETAWQFGRACFDWADFAKDDDQRESVANEGIAACRQLIARDPKSVAGHYYLAMDLGQLAQTKTLGALRIVQEMEREFKSARALDAKFDDAGPERNLGLLYFQAPGWPASIGSRSKARQHLERSVELAPDYPENHLCLLEAYLKWDDRKNIQRELKIVEQLLPKARKDFTGEAWAQSWADWDKRWKKIREKVKK